MNDPLMDKLAAFWRGERAVESAKARIRRCIAKGEIVRAVELSEWVARRFPGIDAAAVTKAAFAAKLGRYRG